MIAIDLTDEQKVAVAAVDEFCDVYFSEDAIKQWCKSRGIPSTVYNAFYDSPLGKYCLPEYLGGRECSLAEKSAVIARLSHRAGAMLPFVSDMLSMTLLDSMRETSRREVVEELLTKSGHVSFSQAFSEARAGSDASAVETIVTVEPDGVFLDGTKAFVSGGQFAPEALILARDPVHGLEDGGLSLWLVPIDTPGVSTFPLETVGQQMTAPATLQFDHVELKPEQRIQTEGKLDAMLKHQYELGRILVCAASMGLALAAMDDALDHASTHFVKGQTLGTLPQIREKLADMEVRNRAMCQLVYYAADSVDKGLSRSHLDCALMKRAVPRMATEVASEALQILGGRGYTDKARVGRIWQDCRGNQIAQGTDEVMVHLIAKSLMAVRKEENRVAEERIAANRAAHNAR